MSKCEELKGVQHVYRCRYRVFTQRQHVSRHLCVETCFTHTNNHSSLTEINSESSSVVLIIRWECGFEAAGVLYLFPASPSSRLLFNTLIDSTLIFNSLFFILSSDSSLTGVSGCDDNTVPQKLLILDARSYTAAVANRAKGGGCECEGEWDFNFFFPDH